MAWLAIALFVLLIENNAASLGVNFYSQSCPDAEDIVQTHVANAVAKNTGIAAGLLRLHFHDCFVHGCDGSVLLDSTKNVKAEKEAPSNFGLRGFEVIDAAKLELELECPGIVSCADIVAYAARDAVFQVAGPRWEARGGRRDGIVSRAEDAPINLPSPLFNVEQLNENFVRKGLSKEDMVTLSGAHTIGVAHCLSFVNRLYNFSSDSTQDPSLDPRTADKLKTLCPKGSNFLDPKSKSVPLDRLTPNLFDNGYYATLGGVLASDGLGKADGGLLTSDNVLFTDSSTTDKVRRHQEDESVWRSKFVDAIIRMGSIQVITGDNGQIRKNCRFVN